MVPQYPYCEQHEPAAQTYLLAPPHVPFGSMTPLGAADEGAAADADRAEEAGDATAEAIEEARADETAAAEDAGVDPGQVPKAAWQLVQKSDVVPQYPYCEQHEPAAQTYLLAPPQVPFGSMTPLGAAEEGAAAVPDTRLAEDVEVALADETTPPLRAGLYQFDAGSPKHWPIGTDCKPR